MTATTQPKPSSAFFLQAGVSFAVALVAVAAGIAYLPVDAWMRAFLAIGVLYVVTSAFTLAKCVRDQQEAVAVTTRVDQARLDKLLTDHDPFAAPLRQDAGMDSRAAAALVDHRAQVETLTGVFAATLARADPAAPLPSSRSWTVVDLAAHLGEVHRWAAEIVRTGRRGNRVNRPDLGGEDHVEFYRARRGELLAALADADPDRACWTLRPTDRHVRFWHRRQAHETLVHLRDLRAAADPADCLGDIDPVLCADGVDELFETFLPRAAPAGLRPLAGPLTLTASDAGRSWTVSPTWGVSDGAQPDAAAAVVAPAGSLLLWAWQRPSTVDVSGDGAVVAAFRRSRFVP